jgi:Uma2 family endonuclease
MRISKHVFNLSAAQFSSTDKSRPIYNTDIVTASSTETFPMSAQVQMKASLSIAEYLAMEECSRVKHEYAAGNVFAMAGASERHNRISLNIGALLHQATRHTDCATFISDMRLKVEEVVYYPDVMVCCEPDDRDPYMKSQPCLIVEVLSGSTERIDRGEKLYNYQRIATLQAYVLVAQDAVRVDVFRRTSNAWVFETYAALGDRIKLDCPQSTLELAEIYERIGFPNPELIARIDSSANARQPT